MVSSPRRPDSGTRAQRRQSRSGRHRPYIGVGGRALAPLLAVALVGILAPAAHAAPLITFRVEAVVDYVDGAAGAQLGDTVLLEYTFDGATPAGYEAEGFANYPAVQSMSVSVGGTAVAAATSGSISVADKNNANQSQADQYRADFFDLTEQTALSDLPLHEVFLQMSSFSDPSAITTLDLPLTPPNPAQFVYFASPYLAFTYRGQDCDPDDPCPSGVVQASVQSISIVSPGPDSDGNGIDDILETGDDTFADDGTTSGSIVDRNGLTVAITDADAPDGVTVRVTGNGTAKATLIVCGITLQLSAGTEATLTCGSVIVRTETGQVEVVLDNGQIVVAIPAGATAEVSDTANGATVENVTGAGVTISSYNVTTAIPAGTGPVHVNSWVLDGFRAPVDNQQVLNTGKAGRAVPLKWHLTDASGEPVTTLTEASIRVGDRSCELLSAPSDPLEQTYAAGSGLINHGNGDYQMNWKTSTSWAGSCKVMTLDLGGSTTKQAYFKFIK